ncbi:MAG: lysylphosphatidylglycerol synthase transmembrane domain-containing protein [Leptospirales bacterium]
MSMFRSILKKTGLKVWAGLFIIFLFSLWAFYNYDFHSVFLSISRANYTLITFAVFLNIFLLYFRVLKWRFFFTPHNTISFYNMSLAAFCAYTLNMVFPARVGLFLQAWILSKKESIPNSSALGTVVLTRVLDGIAIASIGLFVLLLAKEEAGAADFWSPLQKTAIIFFSLYLTFALVFFILGKHETLHLKVSKVLKKILPKRFKEKTDKAILSFREGMNVVNRPGQLAFIFALTFIFWALCALWIFIFLKAFGISEISFLTPFVILVIQVFGFAIPVPGNIGPYHAATVVALSLYGIVGEFALSIAITMHGVILITNSLPGLLYMWYEKVRNPEFSPKIMNQIK